MTGAWALGRGSGDPKELRGLRPGAPQKPGQVSPCSLACLLMCVRRRLSTTRLRELNKATGEQAPRSVRCTRTHTCTHACAHVHHAQSHTHVCTLVDTWGANTGTCLGSSRQHPRGPSLLSLGRGSPDCPTRTPVDPLLSARWRGQCARATPCCSQDHEAGFRLRGKCESAPPSPCSHLPLTPCALCSSSLLPKYQLLPHPQCPPFMQLHFPANTWPNTPSLGALSGQKDGHPQTQGWSRATAGPRPEAGWLSGRGTQAATAPPMMGSGSTAPEQGNRGQGSDEAQEQGLPVPRWTHQTLINELIPKGAYRAQSPGNVHPGQEGLVAPQGGHAWMTLGPGPSPTALLTHVRLVMTAGQ